MPNEPIPPRDPVNDTVEVTVARGRCVSRPEPGGVDNPYGPGDTFTASKADALELAQHGFIEPLDGGPPGFSTGPKIQITGDAPNGPAVRREGGMVAGGGQAPLGRVG